MGSIEHAEEEGPRLNPVPSSEQGKRSVCRFVSKAISGFRHNGANRFAGRVEGGFHPQAVIWVIRLTSPHLPLRVRQPQGRSDGRNERCCSQLRVCSYRAGFSHPPHTPSKPLQPRDGGMELSGIEPLSEAPV